MTRDEDELQNEVEDGAEADSDQSVFTEGHEDDRYEWSHLYHADPVVNAMVYLLSLLELVPRQVQTLQRVVLLVDEKELQRHVVVDPGHHV